MAETEKKPSKHEPPTLKMVVDEYAKLRDAWKRHMTTHEEIDSRLSIVQYKSEDAQAAVEAISEIVKELRERLTAFQDAQKGKTDDQS